MDYIKKIIFKKDTKSVINDVVNNRLCEELVREIKEKINPLFLDEPDINLKSELLRRYYKVIGEQLRNIDYNVLYKEFNNAYLLKNCCKAITSLQFIKDYQDIEQYNIVDLGSGGGAFSLAFKKVHNKVGKFTHIDKSINQIKFSQKIVSPEENFVNIKFEDYHSFPKNYIISASYFLCEQSKDMYLLLLDQFANDTECKGIIVQDYASTINKMQRLFKTNKKISWKVSLKLSKYLAISLKEKYLTTNGIAIFK